MIVLICGGRNYANSKAVFDALDSLKPDTVVDGGATGADALAEAWARTHNVRNWIIEANWRKHGRSAGPKRNQAMLEMTHPDLVIAFPGGAGTDDMVRRAQAAGVEVRFPDKPEVAK